MSPIPYLKNENRSSTDGGTNTSRGEEKKTKFF